jgi:serine O-acetyltransferase
MLAHLRQDYRHLASLRNRSGFVFATELLLLDNGFQAVALYRLSRWFKCRRIPFFGAACARLSIALTGVDINPNADLGPGLVISHGVGLVVGGGVISGRDLLLHHQVTLGAPTTSRIGQVPRIGDGVAIGAGALVIGAIEIGDRAFVGAGTLITRDVPAGAKLTARGDRETSTESSTPAVPP